MSPGAVGPPGRAVPRLRAPTPLPLLGSPPRPLASLPASPLAYRVFCTLHLQTNRQLSSSFQALKQRTNTMPFTALSSGNLGRQVGEKRTLIDVRYPESGNFDPA